MAQMNPPSQWKRPLELAQMRHEGRISDSKWNIILNSRAADYAAEIQRQLKIIQTGDSNPPQYRGMSHRGEPNSPKQQLRPTFWERHDAWSNLLFFDMTHIDYYIFDESLS